MWRKYFPHTRYVGEVPFLMFWDSNKDSTKTLFWFWFFLRFYQKCIFCCAMCGNVTTFCSLSLKNPVQKTLRRRKVCPKFNNLMMEKNRSKKSSANSTLYSAAMKGLTLLPCIGIWTSPVYFAVTKCPSATFIYLSVYTNETGIKSEISGVMWQVTPESKIQLISCKLYPNFLLGLSALVDINTTYTYIFCDSLSYVLFSDVLFIFVYLQTQVSVFSVFQWTFLSTVSGFGQFAMKWSSDPHLKHVFGFRPLRYY